EVTGEQHRGLCLLDPGEHRAPVGHGAFRNTVLAEDGPAQLRDLFLETVPDDRAVRALAADDRGRLGLRVEQALGEGAVDPEGKALAVPGFGGVALEDAPVLARVSLVALNPRYLGVHVVVEGARVGDDVEL